MRSFSLAAFVATMAATAGCAPTSSIIRDRPTMSSLPAPCPVFVMEPLSEAAAFQGGNVGSHVEAAMTTLAQRIIEVVREQCPGGDIIRPADELRAANAALRHGATYLLVPTIVEWKEMRTDDPIGAFILPQNRISITLRLMRLQPPAVAGRVTFRNRSRLTLNQPAERLLNDDFRMAVRQLLSVLTPFQPFSGFRQDTPPAARLLWCLRNMAC